MAWNFVEGCVAVGSGAEAGSVALLGFGLDSFIEVAAAGILIWRLDLHEDDERGEHREAVAHRVVGLTFLLLTVYIVAQAAYVVLTGDRPEAPGIGLGLSIVALFAMPALGLGKRWNAERVGSRALIAAGLCRGRWRG